MEVFLSVATTAAIALSTFSVGALFALLRQVDRARRDLTLKVSEFNLVTKLAAESNNSLADKVMELEQKVDNVEAWRSMISTNNTKRSNFN